MKTLVTGGAGFIGSTLVDRLLDDGHHVEVIDNMSSGRLSNLKDAQDRHGARLSLRDLDIRDSEIGGVITSYSPEVIFHLAAQIDVRRSVLDPIFDAEVNVIGSLNVLEGARTAGTRKVVFASSGGTIYGDVPHDLLPVDESHPFQPVSPYGITKGVMADYFRAYERFHGLQTATCALANVFGPRQDPHGEAGVVAIFAKRLLSGEPCTIYGDGSATRDYIYVDDAVDAFICAAEFGSGLYNIGTGVETSTEDLYLVLAKAASVDAQPDYAPERPGEIPRSALNASRARRELGWNPNVGVEDGARRVLDYFRTHFDY